MDARCTNVRGEEAYLLPAGVCKDGTKAASGRKQMVNESRNNGDEMI